MTEECLQLEFNPFRMRPAPLTIASNERPIPVVFVRNLRARRYVLRMRADGSARVTIPRGGSAAEAQRFAERNRHWVERQIQRMAAEPKHPLAWTVGTEILLRGETVRIAQGINGEPSSIQLDAEAISIKETSADLRPSIERHLWKLAARELPQRVLELATLHEFPVPRVTIRNQKSRWGSCSRRGSISLNWRLIQSPTQVRDYIILHELCHLREMNHSSRFWREVERVCPDFELAEEWLKRHSSALLRR